MNAISPFSSLTDMVDTGDRDNKFGEFFKRMKRKNEDCPEDDDCGEMTSPCCDIKVEIIFGSYPLQVRCTKCGSNYSLRETLL